MVMLILLFNLLNKLNNLKMYSWTDMNNFQVFIIYYIIKAFSNQNLLKYFCLNILNDYIEAFNINKGKAFDDDKYNTF